jgi:hypothetical protein
MTGITAGIRFQQKVQNVDITVYESNAGVGGTWFANRYPVSEIIALYIAQCTDRVFVLVGRGWLAIFRLTALVS